MKTTAMRLGLILAMAVVTNAWAIGGSMVWYDYFSDAAMTQKIGSVHKSCGISVSRSGIYDGGPGWDAYLATHDVYGRYLEAPCGGDHYGNDGIYTSCWRVPGGNPVTGYYTYIQCP